MKKFLCVSIIFLILGFLNCSCNNPYKYKGQQTWLPQNKKGKKGWQHKKDHHHEHHHQQHHH
jgi:hypothetical protein